MHIEPIFVENDGVTGLHSIAFGSVSEFTASYQQLSDISAVREFCVKNIDKKKRDFYGKSMEGIIKDVSLEATSVFSLLSQKSGELDSFFKPLSENYLEGDGLELRKLKPDNSRYPKSKIRVYAIRLSENTYIYTGAAIKLTDKMSLHPSTASELRKLKRVREWLVVNNIIKNDDLNLYYGER